MLHPIFFKALIIKDDVSCVSRQRYRGGGMKRDGMAVYRCFKKKKKTDCSIEFYIVVHSE